MASAPVTKWQEVCSWTSLRAAANRRKVHEMPIKKTLSGDREKEAAELKLTVEALQEWERAWPDARKAPEAMSDAELLAETIEFGIEHGRMPFSTDGKNKMVKEIIECHVELQKAAVTAALDTEMYAEPETEEN